jgi:hypothetical protein
MRKKEFFDESDYSLFNSTDRLDYLPHVDITRIYHGDIFATPVKTPNKPK